jgi:7-carboxy-7-deazaguanine synthase
MTDTFQVNEIFDTVQGEGLHTGVPATFIRLQGCTVGCPWCDTKYTWKKGGSRMAVEQILEQVHFNHVVITGGEPTNYNLDPLLVPLLLQNHYVQVESSGQNDFKGQYTPSWLTWSPKPNLGWDAPVNFKDWVDEVKFVVDDVLTSEAVAKIDSWYRTRRYYPGAVHPKIILMPEGCPPGPDTMAKALAMVMDHPTWRIMDRLQYRLGVR